MIEFRPSQLASSVGNSYYAKVLEVVIEITGWRSDMQMKVRWDLMETGPRAPLGLLGWWNKSKGGNVTAMIGMRLSMNRM